MSSRRQRKRRRSPQAEPEVPGGRRKASPRVLIAAGGVAALVIAAVVLGVALTRGSGSKATTPSVPPLPRAAEVEQLLKGIPQENNVLGRPSAPVTIREYVDLQCPYCAQFETSTMPQLISRYVRPGKAKVEARMIAFIGSNSALGRKAAVAAGLQGKMFNFAQILFLNQGAENSGWLDNATVERAAESIPGLDLERLLKDRDSQTVTGITKTFDAQQVQDQVEVTPTILVGPTGGPLKVVGLSSPSDVNSVAQAVAAALQG